MARLSFTKKCMMLLALLAALVGYIWWGNTAIQITEIPVSLTDLPEEFSGFRIAHISDLHNTQFGSDNKNLIRQLEKCRPDIIVLTGDILDRRRPNVSVAAQFAAQAVQIAPVYYVTGNHESGVRALYEQLRDTVRESGVTVLENQVVPITRGGAALSLAGIHDGAFFPVRDSLTALAPQMEGCTILLAHRPELIGSYAGAGADLVFSGHAHGGQFHFPLIGGVVAPGQGFLPEYDSGLHQFGNTQLIVSRGLGNSAFPFRLNNPPEIVLAVLN